MSHPKLDDWFRLERGELSARRTRELEKHRDACDSCRDRAELALMLGNVQSLPDLKTPPDVVVDRVIDAHGLPRPVPRPSSEPEELEWETAGVRGAADAVTGGVRYMTKTLPGVQFVAMVHPRTGSGQLRVEGRVWMPADSSAKILLSLLSDDHVLESIEIVAGEPFQIEEVVADGWTLELQLPDGRVLELHDPHE